MVTIQEAEHSVDSKYQSSHQKTSAMGVSNDELIIFVGSELCSVVYSPVQVLLWIAKTVIDNSKHAQNFMSQ